MTPKTVRLKDGTIALSCGCGEPVVGEGYLCRMDNGGLLVFCHKECVRPREPVIDHAERVRNMRALAAEHLTADWGVSVCSEGTGHGTAPEEAGP